jgi:hypothetical protein
MTDLTHSVDLFVLSKILCNACRSLFDLVKLGQVNQYWFRCVLKILKESYFSLPNKDLLFLQRELKLYSILQHRIIGIEMELSWTHLSPEYQFIGSLEHLQRCHIVACSSRRLMTCILSLPTTITDLTCQC